MAAASRVNNDMKADATMLNNDNIKIVGISEDSALEAELGMSFDEAYEQYMCARLCLDRGSLAQYSVQELEEEVKYWTGRETIECLKFLQGEINRRNSDEILESDGVLTVRRVEDMEHDEYAEFDPEPLEVMDEYLAKLTYLEMSGEVDGRESEGRILDMMEYVTDDDLQFVADGCNCIVDIGGKYIYPHKDMLVIKRRYYYVCAQAMAVARTCGNNAWLKNTLHAVNEANEGHRIEAHFVNDVLEIVCHTTTPKGADKEFTICMNVKFKQIKHSTFVEPRTNVRFNFDLQQFAADEVSNDVEAVDVDNKEVNINTAVEESIDKGGINMMEILYRVTENNMRHPGTHRYEFMSDVMRGAFTHDPVACTVRWHGKHVKRSTGFKMASVRNLTIVSSKKIANGFAVVTLLMAQQTNDMNQDLVVENEPVRAMTGMAALPRRRYLKNALTLNVSGIASKPDVAEMMSTATWAIDVTDNAVELYMQPCALASIEDEHGKLHTVVEYGEWLHITGKLEYQTNELGQRVGKPHYPVAEPPTTAQKFEAWTNCATVSQKRQGRIPLYAMTEDEFFARRSTVTRGESDKRLTGETLSVKDGANLVARLASHDTATIAGNPITCIAVLNAKRSSNDGAVLYNAAFWPEQEGKFGQKRPVTLKVAGTYTPADAFASLISTYTWKVFVRDELSKNPELTAELDAVLNPTKGLKTDYDGVIVADNVLEVPQILATLDGCKDCWDYDVVDDECSLKDSEDVEKAQHLSSQMFRKLAAVGAESGHYDEAMEIAEEVMRDDILKLFRNFNATEEHREFKFGEKIAEQPLSLLAARIGADMRAYPYIYRKTIKDFLQTLSKKILLGAYELPGFYSLVQPDFCTWLKADKARILHVKQEDGKIVVEVYASGCEGRAVLFKYPCVGNHEYILVRFVSLDEILKRIDALEDISDAERKFLTLTYQSLKPGTLTICANPIVAQILAGFDYDGDEAMVITYDRFVQFFWAYGESVAVNIVPDKVDAGMVIADKWLSAWMQKANAALGNASVGAVTNMGAIFSNLEIMLHAHILTNAQRSVLRALMMALNNGVVLGMIEKGIEYESPIPVTIVDGIRTYTVTNAIVKEVLARAEKMHPSVGNLKKLIADMDRVFRFWQELTIDAVKKIFKIVIPFKAALAEAGICMIITRHGVDFSMVMDNDRKIKDIVLADPVVIADAHENQLGDVMTPIRAKAIELVMNQLQPIVRDYNNAVAVQLQKRELEQQHYKNSDDQLFYAVNLMGRYDRAMNDYSAHRTSELLKKVDWKSLGYKTQHALMTEVKGSMKHEMRCMYDAVSNMLRRMSNGAGIYEIAQRMQSVTVGDSCISHLCSEEVKAYFLDKEQVMYRAAIHLFDEGMKDSMVGDYVFVNNGLAHSSYGQVGHCMAPDGYYAVREMNDKLYVVRYASDDIEVPEVDQSKAVAMIEGNSNVMMALNAFKEKGRNVGFAMVKTSNGGNALRMFTEDGTASAWVVANSATAKGAWLPASQALIDILANKKFRCETIISVPAAEKKQRQLLLILEEIGEFTAPQKENKKQNASAPQTNDQEYEDAMQALVNMC